MKKLYVLITAVILFSLNQDVFSQLVDATWGANGNTAWYTVGNWVGNKYPGQQGVAASNLNIATFTSAYTGTTPGINMGTASLNLGAVSIDNTRTTALNLGNSSATAGVLRLYGATVNAVPNVIVRNNGTGLFTLQVTQNGTMGVVLSNATNNIVNTDNTGGVTISSIISGAGNLTKAGAGTGVLTLTNAANTYTGTTTITSGELRLNPVSTTASFASPQVILNGGKLSTAAIAANTTITASSTLNLNANSNIDLGAAVHSLKFSASNAVAWAGSSLTIYNWAGTPGASGTAGKIFVGTSAAGLTAAQLAKITFFGFTGGTIILATGEIVPSITPTLTVSPSLRSGFTYAVGFGPSASQSFTLSGSNLIGFPGNITVTAPASYEVSTDNTNFFASRTVPFASATLTAQTIYVRLKAGLAINTYAEDVTCSGGGASSDAIVNCDGSVTNFYNSLSDVIAVAASEPATVSSTDNTPAPLTSVTGTKVWDITIRDIGGATPDALPTIVNSITFTQSAGNAVTNWLQAIKTVSLFDGATLVATGTVTATKIQFTAMSYTVPANTSKTLTMRLSLNCGIGGSNKDGDDFGFSLVNTDFTTAASTSSSQKAAFATISSTDAKNVIDVIATKLVFVQQPSATVNVNNNFSPSVTVAVTDACNNVDLNYAGLISVTSTGSMTSSPQTATVSSGIGSFAGISFTATGGPFTLTANSGALSPATSNSFNVTASTALNPGDLIIVGFDTYVSGADDKISLANFVPVRSGTSFILANMVYDNLAAAGVKEDRWFNGNGGFTNSPPYINLTYNGVSDIAKGSIICISLSGNGIVTAITVNGVDFWPQFSAVNGTGVSCKVDGGATTWSFVNFSSSAQDAVFLMQGTFSADIVSGTTIWKTFTGTVFGGIQTNGNFQAFSVAGNAQGNRVSRVHPQMECVAISTGGTNAAAFYGYYNAGANHNDTHRKLIQNIAAFPTNWTTAITTGVVATDGDNLAANGASGTCNTPFTVSTNVSPGLWAGETSTDWFNCKNWDDFNVPVASTDVLINSTATNPAVIDCNAASANQFGNVATAKSLNIIGKRLDIKYTTGSFVNTLNIAGNLTINTSVAGEGLNMDDGNNATTDGVINIGGNWTDNFSTAFKPGNSLINFNSTSSPQTITTPDGEAFYNLTNNNSSLGLSLANSAANVTVNNVLSLAANPFIINTNTLTLNGTVSGAGTLTGSNNSNLTIGGTVGGSLGTLNFTAGSRQLDNLTINRTGAGATALLGSDLSVKTLATITAGIFDAGTNTFNGAGGLTMTGGELQLAKTGVTLPELAGTYALTGGVVNFKGAATQTIRAVDYFDLTSTAAGARTLANSGTTGVANLFTPGTNTYTVTGSTVDFNGLSINQTIPAFTFYNVGFKNGGNKTLGGAINVQKTLTMAGSTAFILGTNNVTLKSVNNLTANVATVPGSSAIDQTGTGRFIIERYVDPLRSWRFLTAPITTPQTVKAAWMEGATPSTTSPPFNQDPVTGYGVHISGPTPAINGFDETPLNNYSIKYFDGTAFVGTSVLPASTDITSQQGWMLFVRGDRSYPISTTTVGTAPQITTLRTRGRINVGDMPAYTIPVTPSGFSPVGNPYPSAIDFSSVIKTGTGDNYYIWDPKITSGTTSTPVGGWIAMTRGPGTTYLPSVAPVGQIDLTTGRIESGVAIMVSSASITDLTINEAHKSNLSATFFRPQPATVRTLRTRLNVRNQDSTLALFDGSLQIFDKSYSNAVNGADAMKPDNIAESFGIMRAGKVLAIEKATLPKASDTLFFKMYKMKARSYTLEFITDNLTQNNLTGFIEDTYLKTKTVLDMNGSTKLDFNIINEPGSYAADRFRIVFKKLINYTNIKATVKGEDVAVDWNVEKEQDIDRYEIERSADGENFSFLKYNADAANNGFSNVYNWIDAKPGTGVYYYRIKGIDKSGASSYSDVVKVTLMSTKSPMYVFPNPVSNGNIGLQFNSQAAGKYAVRLMNELGQVVLSKQLVHSGGTASYQVAYTAAAGNYQLEVTAPDKKQTVLKVQLVQ